MDVPNPRLVLKPGMYASADLELDQRRQALTVPVQAVARKENKTTVMLVNAQGQLESREVMIGLETPTRLELTSGVAEGELVVIGNQSQLRPGQRVEPKLTALGEAKGGR